ncbi:MAG: winged helix-turn-helix transcriptional regulator [Candidatus Lokiarchaeota archaeon]|nr:winged helix-turn-helix transcriptional regulator [Candidatus Lokiarchaeota archaeon]
MSLEDKIKKPIVEFLKVLADTTRLEILDYLEDNEMPASEIKKKLDRSQSTTSKHLNILVDNNLIYFEKKNNIKYYKQNKNIDVNNLLRQINSIATTINKEKLKDIRDADIIETLS